MVYLGKFVKGKAVRIGKLMRYIALNNRLEAYFYQDQALGQGHRGLGLGAEADEVKARLPEKRHVRGAKDGPFQPHEDSHTLA